MAQQDFAEWDGLRVGLVAHTNSRVGSDHLADLIHRSDRVELGALFGPEHGIRGTTSAGELVDDAIDPSTGVPVHSLYGTNRSPTPDMLADLDLLVYDLQGVGARWFTYIATMGLAMQAAAAENMPFVVLERPNPLGRSTSPGYVRDAAVESFIAPYPIADLHGLTSAELARAIVGEGWVDGVDDLDLRFVAMEGWDPHTRWHDLDREWIAPSPALTTQDSALLYPATVLFEATTLSIGRGTAEPFTVFGAPDLDADTIATELNARELPGVSFSTTTFEAPADPFAGEIVHAVHIEVVDHRLVEPGDLGVHLLEATLGVGGDRLLDRPEFLDLLAGGPRLRLALAARTPPEQILAARQAEGDAFRTAMRPYLLH